ncbi:MAG TPA: hypothetical protein VFR24_28110 [Candidatus Angelobacter sp.]|jgi:hypothetical protein|nr:hypothetical protein [Candidatus Angelobacter sp.]
MATEIQYKVFKELYNEEGARHTSLEGKARLYITLITFYLGAIAFRFKDLAATNSAIPTAKWLYSGIAGAMLVALLFTVNALRIRTFEGVFDPEEVIRKFGRQSPSDADFLDDRIVDLSVATNRNSAQNDRIAKQLSFASMFIFLSAIIQCVLVLAMSLQH